MSFPSFRFYQAAVILSVVLFPLSWSASAQDTTLTLGQALDRARQRAALILSAKGRIEETRGRLAGALVRFRDNPLGELDAGPISLTDTHPQTEHLQNATDHHRIASYVHLGAEVASRSPRL